MEYETNVEDAISRIADLESELHEMTDRWMRAEAELINVRTGVNRKVAETRQDAIQGFTEDIIEIAVNLHTGINELPAPTKDEPAIISSVRKGLESIERDFAKILERNGVNQS